MITNVNNDQRIFIVTDGNMNTVCNLEDLPNVWKTRSTPYSKIYHLWNGKQRVASKKLINNMFKAASIKSRLL